MTLAVTQLRCVGRAWDIAVSVQLSKRDIAACDLMLKQVLIDRHVRPQDHGEELVLAKKTADLRVRFFGGPGTESTAVAAALAENVLFRHLL